jgi:hypothetical protein
MADDKTDRGPADRSRINVNEDYEVQYWTEKFACSEEQLRNAVGNAGPSAEAVGHWLATHKLA